MDDIELIRWNNKILWSCAFGMGVGFSNTSETIIPELEKLGYDIYIDDWFEGKAEITNDHFKELYNKYMIAKDYIDFSNYPHVVNFIMEGFWKAQGKYKIGGCFVESTHLRKKYVDIVNELDYVFTSCQHNIDIEKESGVIKPIYIAPPYTDPKIYYYIDRQHDGKPYTFLHVGVIQERKNTFQLIEGYINAFPDNGLTKLVIKSNHSGQTGYMQSLTAHRKDIEYIYTNEKPLSNQEMVKLYHDADCYVNISHGEGTGMPEIEAMSTGLPVIGSNWDARNTFLDNEVGWMLNVDHMDKAYGLVLDEDCGTWAHYNTGEFVNILRYVFDHKEEAKHKGKIASERINNNFTAEKAALGFDAIFMDIYRKKVGI